MRTTDGTLMTKEDVKVLLLTSRRQIIADNELNAFREMLLVPLDRGNETIKEKYNLDMTFGKMKCLVPNTWLNDEVSKLCMYVCQSFLLTFILKCAHTHLFTYNR
jgi:hypothetical protein